jgi:CxxC motif-containing protein (DUF1111 family)
LKEVCVKLRALSVVSLGLLLSAVQAFSQTDPGLRSPGTPAAGGPLGSVTANNPTTILDFFNDAKDRFAEVDSVNGTLPGEDGKGLGPRFNSRSCARCHAFPATGGTSPSVNPQITDAGADGAINLPPSFILLSGPVREARFVFFTDAGGNPITTAPDGGVHDLFTIAGRSDAGACTTAVIMQPDFASAVAHNNVIFRIPTPVFGSGLIENIEETDLLNYQASTVGNPFGISGTFNHNGNDGTIARFGWKAQNKSLEIFAGEAYNVEQGVSNELFTQERPNPEEDKASGLPAACKLNATPEDHTNFNTTSIGTLSDTVQFAMFMRLLEQPQKSKDTPGGETSVKNGEDLFKTIGCGTCHRDRFSSGPSAITPSLQQGAVKLWSDLEIHHMGTGLADNVSQGTAGGDQFRTSPLWGLGQRIFMLHDGRTSDVLAAINAHFSTGSEANTAKLNFDALTTPQKQDILNFLRSL